MRQIETIKLEAHEIGALEMLGKIDCPDLPFLIRCAKCPFHLNSEVALDSGVHTKCFTIICRDIVYKEKKNDQGN